MLGQNIKRFRFLKGISLRELGGAINVSQTTIQKYEQNILTPDGEKLILLAKVLECSVLDLVKDNSSRKQLNINFRKKSTLSAKKAKILTEIINGKVNNYLDVLELNNIEKKPLRKYSVSSLEEASLAAVKFRNDNKINEIIPMTNLCDIIENLGISVIVVNNKENHFDGFYGASEVIEDYPFICIASDVNYYRQRFTLAHELGHLILDIDDGLDREKICDEFASSLLLPKKAMELEFGKKRIGISDREYEIVRDEYKVSIMAIIYSLSKNGIITQSNAKLAYINFNKKYKVAELENKDSEISKKYEQLTNRLYAQEIITFSRFNELMKGVDC